MKTKTLLACLLTLAAPLAHAAPAMASSCESRLLGYDNAPAKPTYVLDLKHDSGRLMYLGAQHSSDPADPQFAEIEKQWNAVKPSVASYEGPNRPVPATRDEAIKQTGESGFVRFLAARDGVPLARLEPEPADEIAYVAEKFTSEQVALFYTLREAARLRERRNLPEAEIVKAIEQLLVRTQKVGSFSSPITDVAKLQAAYARNWTMPAQWWQAPSAWFDPRKRSVDTGGVFTNEVNARSSAFRNVNMYNKLSAAAIDGKRVFAVVGRDHVAQQADALRCALAADNHEHD
ncbi:MAG TPA: hypothetical protein VIT92_12150 [Burkholderiaceae bacterium]